MIKLKIVEFEPRKIDKDLVKNIRYNLRTNCSRNDSINIQIALAKYITNYIFCSKFWWVDLSYKDNNICKWFSYYPSHYDIVKMFNEIRM